MARDLNVGNDIHVENASWTFSGDTAKNFPAHVERSVPLYRQGQELLLEVSDFFISKDDNAYDIGCSTGALSKMLAERHGTRNLHVSAIDVEEAMINQAIADNSHKNVDYICSSALEVEYSNTSFIYAYYTVQFIPPSIRQELINRIYESLRWGGAFIMFEKVRAPDARFQDYMTQLYTEFKLKNGYSSENIVAKSRSLKRVLEPFSSQGNVDMLSRAGFKDIMTLQKYLCFEGFLAIK